MHSTAVILLALGFFVIVPYFFRSNDGSREGFSLGHKRLGYIQIAAGVSMTFVGGAATVNMASLGYQFGWYPLLDPISTFLATAIVSTFLVDRVRSTTGITIADATTTEHSLKFFIGVITYSVHVLISAAQAVALAKVLAPYFGLDAPYVAALLCFLVFAYVIAGGLRSVSVTDIIQLVVILALLVIPAMFMGKAEPVVTTAGFANMPGNLMIFMAFPLVFIPVTQDLQLRIRAAKTAWIAKMGIASGGVLYVLIVAASIFVGVQLKEAGVVLDDPETALSHFFTSAMGDLGVVSVIAVLAAILSTFDTFVLSAITTIQNDILPQRRGQDGERRHLIITSAITFVLTISCATIFISALSLILLSLLIYVSVMIPFQFARRFGLSDPQMLLCGMLTISALVAAEVFLADFALKPMAFLVLHGLFIVIAAASNRLRRLARSQTKGEQNV